MDAAFYQSIYMQSICITVLYADGDIRHKWNFANGKKTNAQVDDIIKVDWARQRFTQLLYYYYHFTYGCNVVFSCTLPWNTFFLFLYLSFSFCIPFFFSGSFSLFLSISFYPSVSFSLLLCFSLFLDLPPTSLSLSNSLYHFFRNFFFFLNRN